METAAPPLWNIGTKLGAFFCATFVLVCARV